MKLSPSALLELEADDAMAAMKSVLQDMQQTLKQAADPHKLTAEHPWMSVGAAAVAGFVGAVMVVPSKEDAALKRLKRIEEALATAAENNGQPAATGPKPKRRSSIWRLMARQGFNMIRPMLLASLTGALGARAAQNGEAQEASTAGDDETTAYDV